MRPIPRTKAIPVGTYILVRGTNKYNYEYIGKIIDYGSNKFSSFHQHTAVGIINSGSISISVGHNYNVTPDEDVWMIDTKDYAKILARVL